MQVPKSLIQNTIFIDIETAAEEVSFEKLSPRKKLLWQKKSEKLKDADKIPPHELYEKSAALYPEFGRIVCVTIGGIFHPKDVAENGASAIIKSFLPKDEYAGGVMEEASVIAQLFKVLAEKNQHSLVLCGHNIKSFDIPYLCRRAIINGVAIPEALNVSGKKPWEIIHKDTMEMWRFGDMGSYVSLDLLAELFGLPSPKVELSGDRVSQAYYEGKINDIKKYCEMDVKTLINVFLSMLGYDTIDEDRFI